MKSVAAMISATHLNDVPDDDVSHARRLSEERTRDDVCRASEERASGDLRRASRERARDDLCRASEERA